VGIDRAELAAQFVHGVDRVERCLRAWPDDQWERCLWPVLKTDAWVWPQPGVEPVPERTDETIQRFSQVWCVAYHCLWFLDFYATPFDEQFVSPEYVRGGPEELPFPAPDGAVSVPDRVWPRDALVRYADHGRAKVLALLPRVTAEQLLSMAPASHPRHGESFEQVLGVNAAHVVEHGMQMERVLEDLRRRIGPA
jgi:hypothetical protein